MSDAKTTLGDLLRPHAQTQASIEVRTKVTLLLDYFTVYTGKRPFKKLLPGMEATKKQPSKKVLITQPQRNDKLRSLRRTEKNLKALIRSNRFSWFMTFTFDSKYTDRQDVDECKRKMNAWLKRIQKKYGKFEYVIVPEFHHDGVSIHFHALLTSYQGQVVEAINPKTGQQILKRGRPVFNFPDYRLGFTTATKILDEPDEQRKAHGYLLKYVTKSFIDFPNKRRYWPSRTLRRPPELYNPPDYYSSLEPSWEGENDYGHISHYEYANDELIAWRDNLIGDEPKITSPEQGN